MWPKTRSTIIFISIQAYAFVVCDRAMYTVREEVNTYIHNICILCSYIAVAARIKWSANKNVGVCVYTGSRVDKLYGLPLG